MVARRTSMVALAGLLASPPLLGTPALAAPGDDLRPGETRTVADFADPRNPAGEDNLTVAVAPDGTVYVAGFSTGQLVRFTPGEHTATPADGVEQVAPEVYGDGKARAEDVAVGADGTVYIADYRTVRRMAPDGTLTTIGGGGDRYVADAAGGPATDANLYAEGIAVDADGAVYTEDNGLVHRIDPNGTLTVLAGTTVLEDSREPADGVPARHVSMRGHLELAVSPAGVVYVTERTAEDAAHLWRIDPDGTLAGVLGDQPPGYAGDGGPAAEARITDAGRLAFAGDDLYLVDRGNRHLRVLDENGMIDSVGPALEHLNDVAVGPRGRLYVTAGDEVSVVSRDGVEHDPVTPPDLPEPGPSPWADEEPGTTHTVHGTRRVWPGPIAAGRDGSLYYRTSTDGVDRVVARVDPASGRARTALDSAAEALAAGPDGSVYAVVRPGGGRAASVVRGYPDGRAGTVAGGGRDTIDGHRATTVALEPTAVTVGPDGHLYVATATTGNDEAGVARLDDDGTLTLVVDTTGTDVRAVNGIAVAGDGTLHLADTAGGRVHHFTAAGEPAGTEEHSRPTAVAVGPEGTHYVATAGGVTEVSADGDRRSVFTGPAAALAVDTHGNVFVKRHPDAIEDGLTVLVRPGEVSAFPWPWVAIAAAGLVAGLVVAVVAGLVRRRRQARGMRPIR